MILIEFKYNSYNLVILFLFLNSANIELFLNLSSNENIIVKTVNKNPKIIPNNDTNRVISNLVKSNSIIINKTNIHPVIIAEMNKSFFNG